MTLVPSLEQCTAYARQGYNLIPIALELPWDHITVVEAFHRLRVRSPHAFLLESAAGGEQVGRYTFMGIEPFATIQVKDRCVVYQSQQDRWDKTTDEPLAELQRIFQRYRAPFISSLPPFQGGAVGYVSYDAVRYFEKVPMPEARQAAYDAHFMLFRDLVAVDRLRHRIYLLTHIRPEEEDLAHGYREGHKRLNALYHVLSQPASAALAAIPPIDAQLEPVAGKAYLGPEQFYHCVKVAKQHIRNGDIFQAVLSDFFQFPLEVDPYQVYRALRMINPSPYLFYLQFKDELLLGASPEMLVKVSEGKIQTCPIAGTRPRGATDAEDDVLIKQLYASVKEKAEHLMLVDLGRNDIGRVAKLGSVRVKDFMHVEKFSHVIHLVSLVEGELRKDLSAWDAFRACFPAGTLSGAPKIRAMEIIAALEQHARGPYGGAVLYHDYSGNLNSCITIRSLYTRGGIGTVQAGAGIVADSQPQREYEEILNKSKAVRKAVALATHMGRV